MVLLTNQAQRPERASEATLRVQFDSTSLLAFEFPAAVTLFAVI
jgi:hypothetical protein